MKQVDLIKEEGSLLSNALGTYYDQVMLNVLQNAKDTDEMFFGKIIGYRKLKVPKYLTIKVPVIEKEYDNDSEYGDGSFRGYLISLRVVKLFRIGTTIEKIPVRRKTSDKPISFTRYSHLSSNISKHPKLPKQKKPLEREGNV